MSRLDESLHETKAITLGSDVYREIEFWIYRHARHLELALWRYFFSGGSKDEVGFALSFYQNEDGGFGRKIEPDNWNPHSTPYSTVIAINILRTVDAVDIQQPMIRSIIRYLESGADCSEIGWHFTIPSNDYYPHAPWWNYDKAANAKESMGITAEIVGFVFRYVDQNTELYSRALKLFALLMKKIKDDGEHGDMGVGGYCSLLNDLKESGNCVHCDLDWLEKRLIRMVNRSIERNAANWVNYTPRPSAYILSPDSIFYPGNEDLVHLELDYLLRGRRPGDVWDLNFSWFDHIEKYPKESAITEIWWKANKAVENMRFLQAFGRLGL